MKGQQKMQSDSSSESSDDSSDESSEDEGIGESTGEIIYLYNVLILSPKCFWIERIISKQDGIAAVPCFLLINFEWT